MTVAATAAASGVPAAPKTEVGAPPGQGVAEDPLAER
jgi:hypothetical protein